jgi:hypothetical protein
MGSVNARCDNEARAFWLVHAHCTRFAALSETRGAQAVCCYGVSPGSFVLCTFEHTRCVDGPRLVRDRSLFCWDRALPQKGAVSRCKLTARSPAATARNRSSSRCASKRSLPLEARRVRPVAVPSAARSGERTAGGMPPPVWDLRHERPRRHRRTDEGHTSGRCASRCLISCYGLPLPKLRRAQVAASRPMHALWDARGYPG